MGYNYNFSGSGEEELLVAFLGIYAAVMGVCALFGLAMYIIRSLSVYTIAKRRGLENPWLSWLPVGHEWILGCLSDQYKYVVLKKRQNRRKVLLGLGIGILVSGLLSFGLLISGIVMGSMNGDAGPVVGMMLVGVVLYFAMAIAAVVSMVFGFMCKYDIYKSCDPKNAVAYLVISIFINVTEPFFLLCCRNKDLGMDPNYEPVYETPMTTSGDAAPKTEPAEEEPAPVRPAELPAAAEVVEEAPDEVPAIPGESIALAAPAVDEDPAEDAPAEDEVPAEE